MATAEVEQPPADPAAGLPDYVVTPNATLGDSDSKWRYGRAPDYSKTRETWEKTKSMNHEALSLPQLVENLVKNWEVEASFKPDLKDWRTVDHENYTFAINGGPPQSAEHMLKVGTYNAIIDSNEYYDSKHSDFASSHKTFKRMMPTFAWEVLEVYSGPPTVSFKWRHWGTMKNDYVGFNNKGEKITAKAHGGNIDIVGVTIATVNDKLQLKSVDTYFDPMQMFKQIAPEGIVNKEIVANGTTPGDALGTAPADDEEEAKATAAKDEVPQTEARDETGQKAPGDGGIDLKVGADQHVSINRGDIPNIEEKKDTVSGEDVKHTDPEVHEALHDRVDEHLEKSADIVHPHVKDVEQAVRPKPGQAVAAPAESKETKLTHEEMSQMGTGECPFLMNRE